MKLVLGIVVVAVILSTTVYLLVHGKEETVILRTTGASFPQYQIQKWIEIYQKDHPNVKIEYEGGGSGHGQEAFLRGLTQIGRTDPPVKENTWNKFKNTGDNPLQFPEIVGAVVVGFNVEGLSELKLSRNVLPGIFLGDIEFWDNASIKALNPGVDLPHKKIVVVHRSDASGTTSIFTTYLSIISQKWSDTVGAGKSVNWPVDSMGRGLGGKGNPGVVATLKSTPYSICYTELSFAVEENLKTASIQNRNGSYVKATDQTIKAALTAVTSSIPQPKEGYRESLKQLLNAQGSKSYPIVAFTHILVWENKGGKHYTKSEAKAVKDFLRWILTDGEKSENLAPGYVGLPSEVSQIGLSAVDMIKTG